MLQNARKNRHKIKPWSETNEGYFHNKEILKGLNIASILKQKGEDEVNNSDEADNFSCGMNDQRKTLFLNYTVVWISCQCTLPVSS